MLDGVILLWFVLAALAVAFVAIDIRDTPESPVLKWGFVLLTAYTGVVGAFLYVLGCREPLPGTHEEYTAARWRQRIVSATLAPFRGAVKRCGISTTLAAPCSFADCAAAGLCTTTARDRSTIRFSMGYSK